MSSPQKKLIEVALPLEAINRTATVEKSIGHGRTVGLRRAKRSLAAIDLVILAKTGHDVLQRAEPHR